MEHRANEQGLLHGAQSGDAEAYGELVTRYRDRLEAIAASLTTPALRRAMPIDDVVQETLSRGLAGIESFEWRGEESFLRWLGSIARRVIAEAARRERRRGAAPLAFDPASSAISPSRGLRRDERRARLDRALEGLPEGQRQVIRLAKLDGLSSAEIAARTGRTEVAVRQSLSRGLRALRERLGDTESLGLRPTPPRSDDTTSPESEELDGRAEGHEEPER